MRGEFIGVWSETWETIWRPLTEAEDVPSDVYCDLYRELANALAEAPSIEDLADIIDDPMQSRQALIDSGGTQFASEKALVRFFEAAHSVLDDLQGDELANRYFGLLTEFIEKYSLGYSLRRPCALSPTLPGMFADVIVVLPDKPAAVTVPETAVDYTLYGDSVYLIKEKKEDDGKTSLTVERTFVRTGDRINGRAIIEKGVQPGDRVAAVGQLKLQSGAAVEISKDPMPQIPAETPLN